MLGSSIVGNATNPLGVFPLTGTVDPSGGGVFKIGAYAGTIRFSGTTFEANYANNCGGRFAIGRKLAVGNAQGPQNKVPNAVCSKPEDFDHQIVIVQGTVTSLNQTTSGRGKEYTTFKLQDCPAVNIFAWGHPTMSDGDHVRVEGEFETERHKAQNTFYNDIEAISIK